MNVRDHAERKYEDIMPATDEGWWESLLAEEQRQHAPRLHEQAATKPRPVPQAKTENTPDIKPIQAEEDAVANLNLSEQERVEFAEPGKRSELFHGLQRGALVKGVVTSITDFGAFIDLGGAEGLIHISELSWGRVSHPNQIVRLGEEVNVQVLEISEERNRVALSLKRMIQNPWERAESDFAIDTIQPAVISSVLPYGSFARLASGVEGLIHISKMPLGAGQTPRDIFTEGQQVQVRVLYIDPVHHRIGLSLQTNR